MKDNFEEEAAEAVQGFPNPRGRGGRICLEDAFRLEGGGVWGIWGSDYPFSGGEGEKWEGGEDEREESREGERRGMGRLPGEESNRTTISRPLARFKG